MYKRFNCALVYRKSKNRYCNLITDEVYRYGIGCKAKVGDIFINPRYFKINIKEVNNDVYKKHMSKKNILDRCNNEESYNKAINKILSYEKR